MNYIAPAITDIAAADIDGFACASRRALITGMGVVAPHASTPEALASQAMEGRRAFSQIERFPTAWCDTDLACSFDPKTDAGFGAEGFKRAWMDRASWYILDALDAALRDGRLDLSQYDPTRIAVVLGSSHAGLVTTEELYDAFRAGRLDETDPRRVLAIPASHVSAVVATAIGAKGVRRTISAACASSTGAMGMALDLIRRDEADIVITGGTDTVSVAVTAGFNALKALARDGCTPFSGEPGITLGEGAGIFVVERMDRVLARRAAKSVSGFDAQVGDERVDAPGDCHAEILGYALSGDAHHATAPDAEGDGIQRVLRAALADAGVSTGDIDYLSAHGTGTDANDLAESRATLAVFGSAATLSSAKSIFGHTLGASGAIETILTLQLAAKDHLPPTLGFGIPRLDCAVLDYIPNIARPAKLDTFICNNYGFGGANASIVLRRKPSPHAPHAATRALMDRGRLGGAIAITGIGLISAPTNPQAQEVDGSTAARRIAGDVLPAALRRKFGRSSPMVKFAIAASEVALQQAEIGEAEAGQTGMIFGVVTGAQRATEKYMESVFDFGPGFASAQHFPHTTNNAPGGAVSLCFGLKGYNATLCGSPGALAYAFGLVGDRRQDRVLITAADEWSETLESFYSHVGCGVSAASNATADEASTALAFREGAAALVFETRESAAKRGRPVLGELRAFAEAQDATFTGLSRRGEALTRAIVQVMAQTGLNGDMLACLLTTGMGLPRFRSATAAGIAAAFPNASGQPEVVSAPLGFAPAHSALALVAEAVARLHEKPILIAMIDLTGCAFAAVVAPGEDVS
jgi:3-oxoacyl-[acyl-carrier-protein] synthase II